MTDWIDSAAAFVCSLLVLDGHLGGKRLCDRGLALPNRSAQCHIRNRALHKLRAPEVAASQPLKESVDGHLYEGLQRTQT
jgi:hypothetical protein